MKTIYLDFETFYDSKAGYTLRKQTYQQYIHDPRFHEIGVSIAIDDGRTVWFPGQMVSMALAKVDWANALLVCQNTMFDAAILKWKFGHVPAAMACTMSMARASGVALAASGASLEALSKFARAQGHAMPAKGFEVLKADGKRLQDFTAVELAAYGQYCCDDTNSTRSLYKLMRPLLTGREMMWHDTVLKMYVEPTLMLDERLLKEELARVKLRREQLYAKVTAEFGSGIKSNPKFAAMLEGLGVTPPMKISKKTGLPALAFAKTDEEFTALLEHDDERVRVLVEVRLGVKSSIEETRTQMFIEQCAYGQLPMGYNVSGAHTGRLGGTQKNNVMNLPSGRAKGQTKALRQAIMAPPGYGVVAADSTNIEVRVFALMSGARNKLRTFRDKKDPYLAAASSMWGYDLDDLTAKYLAGDPWAKKIRQDAKSAELGLTYGAGGVGYMVYCRTQAKQIITPEKSKETVFLWRGKNVEAVGFWGKCGAVLQAMVEGKHGYFGGLDDKMFFYDGARTVLGRRVPGIRLPDGYWLNYLDLHVERDELNRPQMIYKQLKGRNLVPTKVYGSKLGENLSQATAGAVIKYQAALVGARYKVVMQTHDELVVIAPEGDPQVESFMQQCFATVPSWLQGVVLASDVGSAKRYGDT